MGFHLLPRYECDNCRVISEGVLVRGEWQRPVGWHLVEPDVHACCVECRDEILRASK
jgi:hypothetical protein